MSQENVELVRRAYAACNRRDLDGCLAVTHPDADLRASGRLPDIGEVKGREAVGRWFEQLFEVYEMRFEPERIIDGGETIVATVKMTVRGRESGAEAVNRLTHVWYVRDGLLAAADAYTSEADALAAVGLAE